MKIETNKFKIITPDEGMWLCNKIAKTFSDKVYMAVNADHSQWSEVTDEERQELETEWGNELLVDNDSQYTEAGKILMGVSE